MNRLDLHITGNATVQPRRRHPEQRILSCLLAFMLAFGLLPSMQMDLAFAEDEPSATEGVEPLVETFAAITPQGALESQVYGTAEYWDEVDPGWEASTLSSTTGRTLTGGNIYYITSNQTVSNRNGGHGLTISGNVTIRFVGTSRTTGPTLTAAGGNGSAATSGGAGIYLPSGATLTIEGVGTVNASGGNGGSQRDGGAADNPVCEISNNRIRSGTGGDGGYGAGAPGNGIGGAAGSGGVGGAGGASTGWMKCEKEAARASGKAGGAGAAGEDGSDMGALIAKGNVTISTTAGSKYTYPQNGGARSTELAQDRNSGWAWSYASGISGGGGSGGYSGSAVGMGSGAAGGGGGGGGGSAATEARGETWGYIGGGSGGGGAASGVPGEILNVNLGSHVASVTTNATSGRAADATSGGAGGAGAYMASSNNRGGNGGSGGDIGSSGAVPTTAYGTKFTGRSAGTSTVNGKLVAQRTSYPVDECTFELSGAYSSTTDPNTGEVSYVYKWTGEAIEPAVKVTHVPTDTVLQDTEYKVTYASNSAAGDKTASVVVEGTGFNSTRGTLATAAGDNGKGKKTINFSIKYHMPDMSIVWTGAKATSPTIVYAYTGGEVGNAALYYITTVDGVQKKTQIPETSYKKTYSNNTDVGEGTAVFKAAPNTTAQKKLWTQDPAEKSANYSIRRAPQIVTSAGPHNNAILNRVYSLQLEASGYDAGTDKITWSHVSGTLPSGLSLNTETGLISGRPLTKGTYRATIRATNIAGYDEREFTWNIGDVTGFVWNDRNHNGTKEVTEGVIGGITVSAYRPGTSVLLATGVTDAAGYYSFPNLYPANSKVDLRFTTGQPDKYRVIGSADAKDIALGSSVAIYNKGFDIATTITLNAGARGSFNGMSTKNITGFQGDAITIGTPAELDMTIEFGWRLEEWYDDTAFTTPFNYIVPRDDTTLYANYDTRIYEVRYSTPSDAEQVDSRPQLLFEDSNLLPATDPYRPGYYLSHWVVPGTTTPLTQQDTYSDFVNGDVYQLFVTLDSVWELRHDIVVSLDANGSSAAPATINGAPTETHTDLTYNDYLNYSPPIRDGYAFTGWSESKRYDPSIDPAPTMSLKVPGKDITYYATWEAVEVGVIFDTAGGEFAEGEDGMRAGLPGDEYALPENPTRDGFSFLGWFETPTGSDQAFAPEATSGNIPQGKTYYFAQWEPAIITVTLEAEGGTPDTQTAIGPSGSAVAYEFPLREGHTFLGWDVAGETVMFISYPATDFTYRAVWAAGSSTVAYNPMGGSFPEGENGIRQGNTGDSYTLPAAPERAGYLFDGWYKTPEYLERAPQDGIIPAESATYYAKWERRDIMAYLYVDDSLYDSPSGKFGDVIEYATPQKANAAFIGWKLHGAPDATATPYPLYSAVDAQRYDAVFAEGEVSAVFNTMGGAYPSSEDGVRIGTPGATFALPVVPAKAGYAFAGWYDAAADGVLVYDASQKEGVFPAEANTVYYAYYKAAEVKVVLDAGSDATPSVQSLSGIHQTVVPYNVPVRDGYLFAGWKEAGTLDSSAVVNLAFPPEGRAYYAVWTSEVIEVQFETMGGTITSGEADHSGAVGASYAIPQVDFAGNLFLGWYDRPVGGVLVFSDEQEKATIPLANTTYYARWAPKEISATLDAGSGAVPETQAANGFFGSVIEYVVPVKAGNAFTGWKVEGADDATATMTPTFAAEDGKRYSAVWASGKTSVAYDAQGGAFAEGESGIRIGTTGEGYTPPADPMREGFVFSGWFTEPHGQGVPYTATSYPAESNTRIYAAWVAELSEATLEFNYLGSPPAIKKAGAFGQALIYDMPMREGYAFKGWSTTANGSSNDTTYFPKHAGGGQVLFAQWAADAVTLRFHPTTGSFVGSETGYRTGVSAGTYTAPEIPLRAGYGFDGWFTDVLGGERAYIDGWYPSESAVYYAHWTPVPVTIILDQNHDEGAEVQEVTGVFGDLVDYAMPERPSYRFVGWSTDSQAVSGDLHPVYPQGGTTTLYAVWEARITTVTYDAMGGEFADGSVSEHTGRLGDAYDIPVVSRDGYAFDGWFATPLGSVAAPDDGLIPADDSTYYAQWTELPVTIDLQLAGGMVDDSGAAIEMTGLPGETIEWKAPVRDGYLFVGWKKAADPDGSATRFLVFPDADATFFAVWVEAADVVVVYDPYGGTLEGGGAYSGKPGEQYTTPGVALRTGYTFEGWVLEPTDAHADHQAGTIRAFEEGSSLTVYYAKWSADAYRMTLDFNDGVTPAIEVSGTLGSVIDYEELLPNRSGFLFKGWGQTRQAPSTDLFPRHTAENDGATLYAQWAPAGMSVAFFSQGGEGADAVFEGESGQTYNVPANPTRSGYTFEGWYSAKGAAGTMLEKAAGESLVFEAGMINAWFAGWTPIEASAILDATGGTIEGRERISKTGYAGEAVEYSVPKRAGYDFVGWTADDGSTVTNTPLFTLADTVTYQAVWAARQVTLLYDAFGGSFAGDETGVRTGAVGDGFTMPADPTRIGYVFGGWFADTQIATPAPDLHELPTADTTYYAKWSQVETTVQLSAPGSTLELQTLTGSFGDYIYYQATHKPGYTFIGWKNPITGLTEYNPTYPEADTVFEAVFVAGSVVATFDPAGGSFTDLGSGKDSGIRAGSAGEQRVVPTSDGTIKYGYRFTGWYTAPVGGTQVGAADGTFDLPAFSTTYYAHWDLAEVTMTLEPQNGAAAQTASGYHGQKIAYTVPISEGSAFLGWATTADDVARDATLFPVFDTGENGGTLYAQWRQDVTVISFFAMGGSPDASFTCEIGETCTVPNNPVFEGHTFIGWFDAPSGGTRQNIVAGEAIKAEQAGNISYYAQYGARTDVSVTLDAGAGATPGIQTMKGTFGDEIVYTEPQKDGYTFLGWRLRTNPAQSGASALKTQYFPAIDSAYDAVWVAESVTCTFDSNGGPAIADNIREGAPGTAFSLPAAPTRTGYEFVGWYTLSAGGTLAYAADAAEGVFGQTDATYYARWKALTATVELIANGGTFADGYDQKTLMGTIGDAVPYEVPVQSGAAFLGWSTTADDSSSDATAVITFTNQGATTTYFAQWGAGMASTVFRTEGGTFADSADTGVRTGNPGTAYTPPSLEEREGYRHEGWYSEPGGQGTKLADAPVFGAIGTEEYYAHWLALDIEVTLDANGGKIKPDDDDTQVLTGKPGEAIAYESIPTRPGYGFMGWSADQQAKIGDATPLFGTRDETLYAIWSAGAVTLDFQPMGGTATAASSALTITSLTGDGFTVPTVERKGYDFIRWWIDPADDMAGPSVPGAPGALLSLPDRNATYYAQWKAVGHALTLDGNGGSFADSADSKTLTGTQGALVAMLTGYDVPMRSGYTFTGWSKAADGSADASLFAEVDVDIDRLYAAWQVSTVTVAYNAAGGSGGGFISQDAGSVFADIPGGDPRRSGFTFTGWYADPIDDSRIHPAPDAQGLYTVPDEDMTWFAQWEAAPVKLTLDADGGIFADGAGMHDHDGRFGDNVAYEAPTRPGHLFKGWNIDGTVARSITYPASDATYSASWEPLDPVNVTYDMQGGTSGSGSAAFVGLAGASYGSKDVVETTREGYSFEGWFSKPAGEGMAHPEPDAYGNLTYPENDAVWYASWAIVPIEVTLDLAGGAIGGSMDPITVAGEFGTAIPYVLPEREGFAFSGWAQDPNAEEGDMFPLFTSSLAGTTLTAVWSARSVRATFFANGGMLADEADALHVGKAGETFTVPDDPVRPGFVFEGWFTDADLTTPSNAAAGDEIEFPGDAANSGYWAKWAPKPITVALDANGGAIDGEDSAEMTGAFGDAVLYSAPVRTGFTFVGWSNSADDASGETSLTFPDQDATYFAIWKASEIAIAFEGMLGTVSGGTAFQGPPGTPYIAPSALRDGYTFKGWATSPYAGVIDGPQPNKGAQVPSVPTVYFAQWEKNLVKATFDLNGGQIGGSTSQVSISGLTGDRIIYDAPRKSGFVFVGWRMSGTTEDTATLYLSFPAQETTYYAVWRSADLMYANYYAMEGEMQGTAEFNSRITEKYTAPSARAPEGYVFAGWANAPGSSVIDHRSGEARVLGPEGQKNFYAVYAPQSGISITLDPNGGILDGIASPKTLTDLVFGDQVSYNLPTREGYHFLGWATDRDAAVASLAITVPTAHVTFYALWLEVGEDENLYAVYNGNGGEVDGPLMHYGREGEHYTAPGVLGREGYVFKGWATTPVSTAIDHASGDTMTFAQGVKGEYYAFWEVRSDITIRLSVNGGTWDGSATDDQILLNQVYGDSVSAAMPVRHGHLFMGWSTDQGAAFGNPNITVPPDDTVFYAVWMDTTAPTQVSYAFYDGLGGTVEGDTVKEGVASSSYAAPHAVREGHTLAGWAKEIDGDVIHKAGESVNLPASGSQHYYAVWEVRSDITITLDPAGGSLSGPTVFANQVYGSRYVAETPARSGYLFAGWRPIDNSAPASTVIVVGDRDMEYTAMWFEIPQGEETSIVYYDGAGGTVAQGMPLSGGIGDEYTAPTATRDGFLFAGWSKAPSGAVDHRAGETCLFPTQAATTYYALWNQQSTISINTVLNNSEADRLYTGKVPGDLFFPDVPEYANHVFIGWVLQGVPDAQPSAGIVVPAADATYEAVWHEETQPDDLRVVLFDTQGGMLADGAVPVVVGGLGDSYHLPAMSERTGFAFDGWDLGGAVYQPGEAFVFDSALQKVFTARWTMKLVEVTLASPDADVEQQVLVGNFSDVIQYATPAIAGKVFMGWKAVGSDDSTAQRDIVFPQMNAFYEAVWKIADDVTVTYELTGGTDPSGSDEPILKTGKPHLSYHVPIGIYNTGYRFAGWFSMPDGQGAPHPDADTGGECRFPERDAIWYAAWDTEPIALTLDANGGTIGGADSIALEGEIGTAVPYDTPQRFGHSFVGWAIDPTANSGTMNLTYTKANEGSTYYALWKAGHSSVSFRANGGSGDAFESGKAGDIFTVPSDPVREGYRFTGWFDAEVDGVRVDLRARDTLTFDGTPNISYWAQWEPNPVTVTLDGNGGTVVNPVVRGIYGEVVEYTEPLREGHTFRGWSEKRDGRSGTKSLSFPLTDTTYYATWSANAIVVTFDATGGTLSGQAEFHGIFQGSYAPPENPVRNGYVFGGWSTKVAGSADQAIGTFPSQNIVYYAQWSRSSVDITPVNPAGGRTISSGSVSGSGSTAGSGTISGGSTRIDGGPDLETIESIEDRLSKLSALADYRLELSLEGGSVYLLGGSSKFSGKTFLFAPNEGYRLHSLVIDGREVEIGTDDLTFANMQGEHSIDARYILNTATPLAAFEIAARYNPALWFIPAILVIVLGGGGGTLIYRRMRSRRGQAAETTSPDGFGDAMK